MKRETWELHEKCPNAENICTLPTTWEKNIFLMNQGRKRKSVKKTSKLCELLKKMVRNIIKMFWNKRKILFGLKIEYINLNVENCYNSIIIFVKITQNCRSCQIIVWSYSKLYNENSWIFMKIVEKFCRIVEMSWKINEILSLFNISFIF